MRGGRRRQAGVGEQLCHHAQTQNDATEDTGRRSFTFRGNSGKAACYHEIAVYRAYTIKNYGINDIWIIFSLNQGYFASMGFPVNSDAFIYSFLENC